MRVLPLLGVFCSIVSAVAVASAQSPPPSDDPSSAYALLLRGYDLKVQGHCDQAIGPLEASYRALPTTKALINLAQCEVVTGALLRARDHLRTALDLARRQDAPRV